VPINLDFSNVKAPEPLPEGDVLLRVVDCAIKPGKENPEYEVAHMRYELEQPSELAGRKVRDWISFHPDALWSAKVWVAALLRLDDPEEVTEFTVNETAIVGELVGATLALGDEFKGRRPINVVAYFNPEHYDI
jgi:hypothetical protein